MDGRSLKTNTRCVDFHAQPDVIIKTKSVWSAIAARDASRVITLTEQVIAALRLRSSSGGQTQR